MRRVAMMLSLALVAGSLAIAGTAGMSSAGPARVSSEGLQAARGFGCDDGDLCFFGVQNYGGQVGTLGPSDEGLGWVDFNGDGFDNNVMSSWRNRSNHDGRWARFMNGNGEQFCMDANTNNPSLNGDRDNDASSARRYSTNDVCGA